VNQRQRSEVRTAATLSRSAIVLCASKILEATVASRGAPKSNALYPSPLSALTHTAHRVSFVLVFLLTVRHMCLFQFILLFRGLYFVAQITLARAIGLRKRKQPLSKREE